MSSTWPSSSTHKGGWMWSAATRSAAASRYGVKRRGSGSSASTRATGLSSVARLASTIGAGAPVEYWTALGQRSQRASAPGSRMPPRSREDRCCRIRARSVSAGIGSPLTVPSVTALPSNMPPMSGRLAPCQCRDQGSRSATGGAWRSSFYGAEGLRKDVQVTTWEGPSVEPIITAHRLTLGDFLIEVAAVHADREAIVFDDPLQDGTTIRWSYADLEQKSRAVAAAFVRRGVGLGTRVALVLGDRPEMVAAIFGVALAGGIAVPISTFSSRLELTDLLARSAVAGVVTQSRLLGRDLGEEISGLVRSGQLPFLGWCDVVDYASWAQEPRAEDAQRVEHRQKMVSSGDPGLILFSSGTTTEPKGMVHLHRAPTLQFWLIADVFRRTPQSRVWAPLPLFWTARITTALGPTLAGGGCFVLQETFQAGRPPPRPDPQ